MMGGASSRRGLWLDPRTKILLLLFCILSAMMAPSLFYELGLVVLIGLLGVCFGKWKYAWKGVLFYALIVLLTLWIMDTMTGTWRTMFIAFLGLFHKVYPCGMLSGIVLSTTKVSEFLSAMNRMVKLLFCRDNAEQVDDKGQQNNGNEDKHHRGKVVGLAPLIF